MSVLSFRPATESDVEFLTSLRRQTMWVHLENAGRPIDEAYQFERVLDRFDCARVVSMDGADIGLLKVARDVDPWELMQIQLLPAYQRRGLGEKLLNDLLGEARTARKSVVLRVLRANPAGRLYERLGFRVVGQSEVSYQMRIDHADGSDPDPSGPHERFSGRGENYVRYRPRYPAALIDLLGVEVGLVSTWSVADVGSGTGFSSEPFLNNGNTVWAIEPNAEMRDAGEALWGDHRGFVNVAGSAEATGLDANSVDLVVAGQAFHWFDHAAARREWVRILKQPGWVVLFWNMRVVDGRFAHEYDAIVREFGKGCDGASGQDLAANKIRSFFGSPEPVVRSLANEQLLNREGLRGRFLSSSYAPQPGHPDHSRVMADLGRLFDRYEEKGVVRIPYRTEVFMGQVETE